MPSTSELRYAVDNHLRQILGDKWGYAYANEFCDGLLLRLIQPNANVKIHLWLNTDGTTQVNIDIGARNGYTVDVTDDPLMAIGKRLNEELVCDTNSHEDGTDGKG